MQVDMVNRSSGLPETLKSDNGAALVSDVPLNTIKYAGSGYTYFCETTPGAACARSAPAWRVLRLTDATGDAVYAGAGRFEHAATDLGAVAALTYTLGA